MLSRAARVRMSAQDTTLGQAFSTAAFMSSIMAKPTKDELGSAAFSLVPVAPSGLFRRMDASQPCTTQYQYSTNDDLTVVQCFAWGC